MMDDTRTRDTGRLALGTGGVAIGSAACLAGFFAVGQPLGTINDIGNATTALLAGWLAWRLRGELERPVADAAVGLALAGAAISAVGSGLVLSGTTGFFLGGLVSSLGSAGIGAWLIAMNRSRRGSTTGGWPKPLRRLGIAAGALMAAGVVSAPGIALRLDDMATAPPWVWIGFLSWLGTYVAFPAWTIWMGSALTRAADQARLAPAATSTVAN
jgi:hypothetical protein